MGQHFGELATVRGIVIHKLSPFEQRAFAGVISKGVPNTFRRIRAQMFRVAPRKLITPAQLTNPAMIQFSTFSLRLGIFRLQLGRIRAQLLLAQEPS